MHSGVDVTPEDRQKWRDEVERINRRILYLRF